MALNQKSSPLLRLPGELRNKIYALAAGGFVIIVENNGKPASPFDRNPPTKLSYCLAMATVPVPAPQATDNGSKAGSDVLKDDTSNNAVTAAEGTDTKNATGGILAREKHKAAIQALPGPEAERVSSIFTLARVCRQMSTETAHLQYKQNVFRFGTELALRSFSATLKPQQRNAITAISITVEYVMDKLLDAEVALSRFRVKGPTTSFRDMLPGLRTIYFNPRDLMFLAGQDEQEKMLRVVGILDLGCEDDVGLHFRCFDVLNATAGVEDVWGLRFRSLDDEPVGVDMDLAHMMDSAQGGDDGENSVDMC